MLANATQMLPHQQAYACARMLARDGHQHRLLRRPRAPPRTGQHDAGPTRRAHHRTACTACALERAASRRMPRQQTHCMHRMCAGRGDIEAHAAAANAARCMQPVCMRTQLRASCGTHAWLPASCSICARLRASFGTRAQLPASCSTAPSCVPHSAHAPSCVPHSAPAP
eukprot:356460-Chlamydomonas_euryale.AAC.3